MERFDDTMRMPAARMYLAKHKYGIIEEDKEAMLVYCIDPERPGILVIMCIDWVPESRNETDEIVKTLAKVDVPKADLGNVFDIEIDTLMFIVIDTGKPEEDIVILQHRYNVGGLDYEEVLHSR